VRASRTALRLKYSIARLLDYETTGPWLKPSSHEDRKPADSHSVRQVAARQERDSYSDAKPR
jgi:hypothetical protein